MCVPDWLNWWYGQLWNMWRIEQKLEGTTLFRITVEDCDRSDIANAKRSTIVLNTHGNRRWIGQLL
jgi:hypothetical protein